MQEWQRQKGSKGKGFGLLVCRRSASAVTSRGLHPRQFAARGRAGQVAPWAARCRSCSSRGQRTSAGVAPQAIRGAWPRGTSRALGSSLSLVLIERPAHVRGGCTPGNSRRVAARDKSRLWQLASLVLIERSAHVRGGCTPGNSRRVAARDKSRLWQLASVVLIERPAHVRGGCTPGNSRLGQLASLVLIERLTHVRGGGGVLHFLCPWVV